MMDMKAEGRNYLTSHIGFLGDHLSVTDTDPSLMDNAQYYRCVRIAQKAAEILGEENDAAVFSASDVRCLLGRQYTLCRRIS